MTFLQAAGTALNAITALLALAALVHSARRHQSGAGMLWLFSTAGFGLFTFFRAFSLEEHIRSTLRGVAGAAEVYDQRGALQLAAVLAVLLLCACAIWLLRKTWLRTPKGSATRPALVAAAATAAMVVIYGLRLISLHAVDQLLYSGPVRLNWLLELGLSALVAAAAATCLSGAKRA